MIKLRTLITLFDRARSNKAQAISLLCALLGLVLALVGTSQNKQGYLTAAACAATVAAILKLSFQERRKEEVESESR